MFLSARHGRFTPLPDAQPPVGAVETGEQVSEVRVKCVVEEDVLDRRCAGLCALLTITRSRRSRAGL